MTQRYYPVKTLLTKEISFKRFIQEYSHNCVLTARYTMHLVQRIRAILAVVPFLSNVFSAPRLYITRGEIRSRRYFPLRNARYSRRKIIFPRELPRLSPAMAALRARSTLERMRMKEEEKGGSSLSTEWSRLNATIMYRGGEKNRESNVEIAN